jgi:hypothetical protein
LFKITTSKAEQVLYLKLGTRNESIAWKTFFLRASWRGVQFFFEFA